LKTWLLPMLELVGAEVLTSDDADGFKEVADEAGVHHQICRRHVTTNVLTFFAEQQKCTCAMPMRQHPRRRNAPPSGIACVIASWHLWNNWTRLTCYLTLRHSEGVEINDTNNNTGRAIGWPVKERYRSNADQTV